jgi:uncharacterized protein YbbK (DUF523 family)
MIRIGLSACLLGEPVRYDGGHKRDATLLDTLGPHVTWVPVCPEVELGLGVPRPPMHLGGEAAAPRLVVTATGEDVTARMEAWAAHRLAELRALDLHGYVFKSCSPSCCLLAGGLFAAAFTRAFPGLPVEEETRLADPRVCTAFLERARALASRR